MAAGPECLPVIMLGCWAYGTAGVRERGRKERVEEEDENDAQDIHEVIVMTGDI